MTYEEMKEKELQLLKQLESLRKGIAEEENGKINDALEIAIKNLKNANELTNDNMECVLEVYCEECEQDIDVIIPLSDIIQSLIEMRGVVF